MPRRPARLAAAALALVALTSAALVAAAPVLAQAVRSHGDPQAEAFVQAEASRVLQVLSEKDMTLSAKKKVFRTLIDEVADVPRITSFVLGRYRRVITPAQYDDFASAFRAYADNVYESRLNQYSGQTLKVTGSIVRQPGDVVVTSDVVAPNGAKTAVNWRVIRGSDGRFRAVDVQVAGVWLAITEQQDFVSTLDNNNGDVAILINQLRKDAGAN
jgi:phospholipid transport system substrate-binding protein